MAKKQLQARAAAATLPRSGGRPSARQAERLSETILDVATELFLTEGYGATSIETVAQRARISKRTFYHRYQDKAELFGAVIHRLIERMRPNATSRATRQGSFEEVLLRLAKTILRAAVSAEALALLRVVIAEAKRFPELAAVLNAQGGRQQAISHIVTLLEQETRSGRIQVNRPALAAEQFLQMVISAPQRRALGLGTPLSPRELDEWAEGTVDLFLNGCRPKAGPG